MRHHLRRFLHFLPFFFLAFSPIELSAQGGSGSSDPGPNPPEDWIAIQNPGEGQAVIGKTIRFEGIFKVPLKKESLVIILDNVDVTQVAEVTPKGFVYNPIMVLAAGGHSFRIESQTLEGTPLRKELFFTIRHSQTFEELYSKNEVSVVYEGALKKADGANDVPYSKIEGGLISESRMRNENWDVSFKMNMRYFDQSAPVYSPMQIGIYPASYLLSAYYKKDAFKFGTDIGDVMINESYYTAQNLARRGGLVNFNYQNVDFRAFSVLSNQVIGFTDGLGIKTTDDDHIQGVSGGMRLFQDRVTVRGVYVRGGESGNGIPTVTPVTVTTATPTATTSSGSTIGTGASVTGTSPTNSPLGTSTITGKRQGEAMGFLVNTDFFKGLLKADGEISFSRFDPDTSDSLGTQDDDAYRFRLGGLSGSYSYEALYEYVGRDYQVVGNPMIQKDRKGFTFRGAANWGIHNAALYGSRYTDNVKEDPLLPRLQYYQGGFDYTYNGIQKFPLGFGYKKTLQDTLSEPEGSTPSKIDTDTVYGKIGYLQGFWNLGFQVNYSRQDDKTTSNNDSNVVSYILTTAYNDGKFSLMPSFSLIQTDYLLTSFRTDNYLVSLQLMGKTYQNIISYELGGSYSVIKTTNNSVDSRSLNGTCRLGYSLAKYLRFLLNPTVALKGIYNHAVDQVYSGMGKDDLSILLVLSTSMPFSF
jgi:hypothetical protein